MRIVRPDGSVIEGTPSEIAQFEQFQTFHTAHRDVSPSTPCVDPIEPLMPPATEEDWDYVSTDVALRCLTRLKLSKHLKATLRMIYAGGQTWISAADIQVKIGYNSAQFGGMMGAFGRRLINTGGYVINSSFFEYEWDDSLSCYKYRLPSTVRAAVVQARIVS